jgi:two-component sensor histidine kinase
VLKTITRVAAVGVAYYVVGRLALFLAIPPGYATAVWPAAGVALVAILLLGYRVWPGILAAHFFVNIFTAYDGSSLGAVLKSVTLALAIASGGVLQAVCGAALIRRTVGSTIVLQDEREIAKFLALGGPVSCVISATVGSVVLYGSGMIPVSDIPFSWFTWWVGDTIGVMVMAPLLLAWFAPPRERWRSRRAALTWPTAIALSLAVGLYVYISGREQQRIRAEFERAADTLGREFSDAVGRHLEAVMALQDLYASVGPIDRAGFAAFASPLQQLHPGVQALEWAPVVPLAQRARLEDAVRREGYPAFAISDRSQDGRMVPAPTRAEYVPVLFMQPYQGNETALGFDLTSLPSRREVIDRARDSALPAASGRLALVQERGQQSGVLVVLPVYDGPPPATIAQRRSALRGYVLGVYRVGDLVQAALLGEESLHIDLTVTDDTAPPTEQLLFARRGRAAGLPWTRVVTTDVGDHHWSIRFTPAADFAVVHRNWQAWTVLVVGLLFASVLEMMVLLMTERAAAIQRVVEQRTADLTKANAVIRDALKEKETLLQEIHHRVKNNLQVISSLINIQLRKLGPGASRDALQECQTRVQAIALIHEQLYQSRDYSRVPFSQYARSLAANVFHAAGVSPGAVSLEVEVGEVALAVDKAIPCGLILNELITNSLKHAFPQERRGTVRVELDQTATGRVRLAVTDDGVGLPADLDFRQSDTLGMQLVCTLAEQLAAKLDVSRTAAGTSFEVVFQA